VDLLGLIVLRPRGAVLLTLLLAAGAAAASDEGTSAGGEAGAAPTLAGRVSSTLGEDSMAMRLGLVSGPAYLGIGLDASPSGSFFLGGLKVGDDRGRGPCFLAGPGSASGYLRLLADPATTTALAAGAPVVLDRGLSSRSAVASLRAGPLTVFGVGEGKGPLAFASRGAAEDRSGGAAAGGVSLAAAHSEYRFEALAAASYAEAASPITGWRPDPYAAPALNSIDAGAPLGQAALVAERRSGEGGALVALSGSYGRLAGPAGALRMQAREELGPLGLALRAGAAQSGYRALYGKPEERLLGAVAEVELALPRAASISLSAELEAEGQGLRYAPLWGDSKSLELALPLSAERYRFLEARLEAKRSAMNERKGSASLAMESGRAEEGGISMLSAAINWERRFDSLELSLSTELAKRGGLPSLGLDIGLELFDGASAASPVMAEGGVGLELPCGEGGSLSLDLDLPEGGMTLEPRAYRAAGDEGEKRSKAVLSIRYKASFGSPKRRPRSRRCTGPKAISIAQRAAS
jgi:hypothetical protein